MKYRCYGSIRASKYLGEFEANSEKEARELAEKSDEFYVSMCHQCASECEDPEIIEIHVEKYEE